MMVVFPPLENDEYFAAEFDEETGDSVEIEVKLLL